VWEEALGEGVNRDAESYNAMLRAISRDREATSGELEALVRNMRLARKGPDQASYGALATFHARRGDIWSAHEALQRMEVGGYHLDTRAFNTLLVAASSNGDIASAESALSEMDRRGIARSDLTYALLFHCCAEAAGASLTRRSCGAKACRFEHHMQSQGKCIAPAPFGSRDFTGGRLVYAGFEPSLQSLGAIIKACAAAGWVRAVERRLDVVHQRLASRRCTPVRCGNSACVAPCKR